MRKIFVALSFLILAVTACKDERSDLGDQYFKQGKYDEAVQAYTEYLKLEPRHVKTIYNRGRAYEELGQHENAVADFQQVIKEDPENVNAYLSIANDYYYRQSDYDNTIFFADKALALKEKNPVAQTIKGKAYQKLGKLNEAMAAYNAAISVDKEYADAYQSRGLLKIHIKQRSSACADIRLAKSLGSDSAEAVLRKYCK